MDDDQFDVVGRQMMYNQIIAYWRNIPDAFAKSFPVLADAANQRRIRKAPYNNKEMLRSSSGVQFLSFAKSDKWQKGVNALGIFITYYRYIV